MPFSIKNATLYAILATLSITLSSQAYIYQIDVWEKQDNKGKVVQQLYCMSDIRVDRRLRFGEEKPVSYAEVDQEQRALLLDQCKKLSGKSTLFIVEDLASLTDIVHPKVRSFRSFNKELTLRPRQKVSIQPPLLHFLADLLREQGQSVINVESRHLLYGALAIRVPQVSMIEMPPSEAETKIFQKNVATYAPTNQEIAQEFKNAMARARAFCATDGPLLAHYYGKMFDELDKTASIADLLDKTAGYYHDFVDYCSCFPCSISDEFVYPTLSKWGWQLLDITALHHVHQASSYQKICIIMETSHVHTISNTFPAMGYKKIKTIGTNPLAKKEWDTFIDLCAKRNQSHLEILLEDGVAMRSCIEATKAGNGEKIKALEKKLAQAKPISNADFNVLTEKKSKRQKKKSIFSFLNRKR